MPGQIGSIDDKNLDPLISSITKLHLALLFNGLLAFMLNYVSFTANKRTSALSMTVAGNVKQAMSIGLSVFLYSYVVSFLNGIGKHHPSSLFLHYFRDYGTLIGGAWYSAIGLREKDKRKEPKV